MIQIVRHLFAFIIVCAICLPSNADTSDDLRLSVRKLNTWLGNSENATGWRRYLRLNVLETQAAKGYRADVSQLNDIYNRFSSGANGLSHPAFNDVRLAIGQHMTRLTQLQYGNLPQQIDQASQEPTSVSLADLDYKRRKLIYDLFVLKKYYQQIYSAVEHRELLKDLMLDDTISFLNQIEFQLPPENSPGKIAVEVRELQRQLNQATEDFDGLPLQQPDEDSALTDQRKQLETKMTDLKAQIDPLRKRFAEARQADLPRLRKRAAEVQQLAKNLQAFAKLSKDQMDPYYVSARNTFSEFIPYFRWATDDNFTPQYQQQLNILAKEFPQLGSGDGRNAAARIGAILGWLNDAGQSPALRASMRAAYSLPNIELDIATSFINRLAAQPVNKSQPVNEYLLGRLMQGTAFTTGNVTLETIDNPNEGQISIRLLGRFNSNTYTRQGPITAYGDAYAMIEARRSLFFNLGGLIANDAYGAANLGSSFRGTSGINIFRGLIDRIANKQYLKTKSLAEGISAGRVERRMVQQFREQTTDALNQGRDRLSTVRERGMEFADLIPHIYLRTSSSKVHAVAIKEDARNLAAIRRPVAGFVNPDIALRINETALSNYADPFFRGETFTNEELADQAAQLSEDGERPPALTGDKSWSITFSSVRPIQFEFENNRLAVVITGTKFSEEDNAIDATLEIRLQFKMVNRNGQLKLVRDGDATVEISENSRKTAATVAFRDFLERKLNNPASEGDNEGDSEAAEVKDIDLPNELIPVDQVEALQNSDVAKALRLVECRMVDGWLYLGWNYQPGTATAMGTMDLQGIEYEAMIPDLPLNNQPGGSTTPSPSPSSIEPTPTEQPSVSQPQATEKSAAPVMVPNTAQLPINQTSVYQSASYQTPVYQQPLPRTPVYANGSFSNRVTQPQTYSSVRYPQYRQYRYQRVRGMRFRR